MWHNFEEMLRDWIKGKRKGLPFRIPITWREPKDYTTDCYFCQVNSKAVGKTNRRKIIYLSVPRTVWPTQYSDEQPIPVFIELSPSEEESIEEMQATNDLTQEILTDFDDASSATS